MTTMLRATLLKGSAIAAILFVALCLSFQTIASSLAEDSNKRQKVEAMYESYRTKAFPGVSDLSVEQLLEWQEHKKIILVDVRTPEERDVSMIPSAIPVENFEKNIDAYQNDTIVYYCTIGYRSGLHTEQAHSKNVNAYNLRGGVLAWAHAGQTFVDSEGESLNVHVYGRKWNLTPQNYTAIW